MWGTPQFHGFQVSLWVSRGIASGIATGTRKCVISGVCFKWHEILTSSMLQFYSWTVALEKRPWPHKDAFSTYLSTVTIWINIITITIIISIITIIKLMMRYELVSCIPYRSTYHNISILFNVTISYILDDRPSCNYPGRPAHCDCSSVALWHQKIGKSCAQQEASIINKV